MSDRIKDLLGEVADGVEPGDRLDTIRAATAADERRTGRGWWAAGGVGLLAASVVTALALTTGGTPQGREPDPAQSAPTSPSETAIDPSTPTATEAQTSTVAVYYIGDTPDGPRLYREFRRVEGTPMDAALAAAVGTAVDGRQLAPQDPDYRIPWPPLTRASAQLTPEGDVIEINLEGDPQDDLHGSRSVPPAEAQLAVEQLIRTAQGVVGDRLPVRFLLFGDITDQVLGVPTSEPLTTGSDLSVLAHVSLTTPAWDAIVDNDEPLVVTGLGNSYEGNIVTRLRTYEGRDVIPAQPTIAGTYEDRLFPFEVSLDLSDVPPGDYEVESHTDDPSGEGRIHVDSKQITVVD